jgi:hypothetical protein
MFSRQRPLPVAAILLVSALVARFIYAKQVMTQSI